jgi:hypothetical protein
LDVLLQFNQPLPGQLLLLLPLTRMPMTCWRTSWMTWDHRARPPQHHGLLQQQQADLAAAALLEQWQQDLLPLPQ